MRAVVGVSMGSSAIRAAVMDPMGRALLGTEAVHGSDPATRLATALSVIDSVARRHHAHRDAAVLVVPDDPHSRIGHNILEIHDGGAVRLASELGAQLMYLRMRGLLGPSRTVAVVDVGRTGMSVSVLDSSTGHVYDAMWSETFRGAMFAEAVFEHLITEHGDERAMTSDALDRLSEGVEWSLEMLALHRVVRIGGPFVDGSVDLWRSTVDHLLFDALADGVEWVRETLDRCPRFVDTVVLLGGCANLPIVRGTFSQSLGSKLVTPSTPESVSAKGAALLAVQRPRTAPRSRTVRMERQTQAIRQVDSV
ncbi:Hsp70 family protein [Actinomycetes bacterium M1A6_2h]